MEKYVPPFMSLTNYQLEVLFLNTDIRLKQILDDHKLKSYLAALRDDDDTNIECSYYNEDQFNQTFKNKNTQLSVFHLNIASLWKHGHELAAYLEGLIVNFDVIMLSEVGKNNIECLSNLFDNYNFEFVPAKSTKGGVGIYYKQSHTLVSVTKSQLSNNLTCGCGYCEVEDICIKLIAYGNSCTCMACYRHPNGNVVHFVNALENVLSGLQSDDLFFFGGDINVDLIKTATYPRYDEYLKLMLLHQMMPVITVPTRITDSSITLIDHIFVRLPKKLINQVMRSGNLFCDISDHLPNFCCVELDSHFNTERPWIRLYSEKNLERFAECAEQVDFSPIYRCENVNLAYEHFHNAVTRLHEQNFPLVRVSRKQHKSKPWVTAGIKKSISHKNILYRKYVFRRTQENKQRLTTYRSVLNKTLKQAETEYYKGLLSSKDTSARTAWGVINKVLNSKPKKGGSQITSIDHNGTTHTSDNAIADAFNDYFANIGPKLATQINSNSCHQTFMDPSVENTIFLTPVTDEELIKVISSLKVNKAPGIDCINVRLLQRIHHIVTPVLTYIFNLSFCEGQYPNQLKIAKVIPLYKKGCHSLPENYRPISLLSCFNKLLEKLIEKRLRAFLHENRILYEYQFGFRSGYSTSYALLEIVNDIRAYLDKGENVLGLYLDLKKAFDTVNHTILKQKLYNYGIRGKCHDLLSSYLTNRKQRMFVNGLYSGLEVMLTGVPQGSVLGPLLFLIYVNDIKNVCPEVSIRLFADDTNVFLHNQCCKRLKSEAQKTIKTLKNWFDANKLTLHLGKTNFTLFHSRRVTHDCFDNFEVDQYTISRTASTKYLGVIIDEDLSWEPHVTDLCNKLIKYSGIFFKTRTKFPNATKINLYYAFVYSRIAYCAEIYGSAKNSILHPLQILQNRLIKILLNLPMRTKTSALYLDIGSYKICDIHKYKMYTLLYKYTKGEVPDFFIKLLNPCAMEERPITRNNTFFTVTRPNTQHGKLLLNNYCSKIWREIPDSVKCAGSLNSFKNKLKHYILDSYK